MPEFHETRMGQKYYGADLPRMIEALEKIAEGLTMTATEAKAASTDESPVDMAMAVLEDVEARLNKTTKLHAKLINALGLILALDGQVPNYHEPKDGKVKPLKADDLDTIMEFVKLAPKTKQQLINIMESVDAEMAIELGGLAD